MSGKEKLTGTLLVIGFILLLASHSATHNLLEALLVICGFIIGGIGCVRVFFFK